MRTTLHEVIESGSRWLDVQVTLSVTGLLTPADLDAVIRWLEAIRDEGTPGSARSVWAAGWVDGHEQTP